LSNVAEYTKSAESIIALAEQGFGTLSDAAKKAIRILFLCIHGVDSYVDSHIGKQKGDVVATIISCLKGGVIPFADTLILEPLFTLRSLLNELDNDRKSRFIRSVEIVFSSAEVTASTRTVKSFVTAREAEGHEMALLVLSAVKELDRHPGLRQLLPQIGSIITLSDSITDYPLDIRDGAILISPDVIPALVQRVHQISREITGNGHEAPEIALQKVSHKVAALNR
jgi:hypothetical protein